MIKAVNFRYQNPADLAKASEIINLSSPERHLIQVFTSETDTESLEQLLNELTSRFPKVPVIGTSTAGEIIESKSLRHSTIISVTSFETSSASSFLLPEYDGFSDAGTDMGLYFKELDIKSVIAFYSGMLSIRRTNSAKFIKALHKEIPDVIIAGGQAGEIDGSGNTVVFTEAGISEHGIAFASIGGESLSVTNTNSLSWAPIGKELTITRADHRRIYEIDHKTPQEICQHYLGVTVDNSDPLSIYEFPLMRDRKGILGVTYPHTIHDDGSFEYLESYRVGEKLRFGICHVGTVAEDARKTYEKLREFIPQTIFVYSCTARKAVLRKDTVIELYPLKELCPTSGFYTFGEYFSDLDTKRASLESHSITTLALKECELGAECPCNNINALRHFNRVESTRFKKMQIFQHLLETNGREISALISQLAEQANRDALTQLGNRRMFDDKLNEELEILNNGGPTLSLMLIDVDFFKQYNDNYGHVAGDTCLTMISRVLGDIADQHACYAARYGGEEFAMIMPYTPQVSAFRICKQVNNSISDMQIGHEYSGISDHVTVSIGCITIEVPTDLSTREVLHHCDEHLYEAKQQGRNRAVTGVLDI